ncbi:MAG: PEGA domain-containing protein [Candidatus Eremiobacteraeota bacterium]|nr:PEGA domain-containing protein [Candidatus Eremiobacteraeota bacterium]
MTVISKLFKYCVCLIVAVTSVGVATPTMASGGVYLTTLPSGADVWVDGMYVGRTPILLDGLESGKHAVTLTKLGFSVAEIEQRVGTEGIATGSVVLQRSGRVRGESGRIVLHGLQPGSQVSLDGVAGARAAVQTPSGLHQIVVHVGKTKMVRSIAVFPGTTTDVVVSPVSATVVAVRSKSVVVAPAEQYLPDSAFRTERDKVLIDYRGHIVVAHLGQYHFKIDNATVAFDAPPAFVHGKLYLPLELLLQLTKAERGKLK